MEDPAPNSSLPSSPSPAPSAGDLSPAELRNLLAAGLEGMMPERNSSGFRWEPPSLGELRTALPQYEIECFVACGGMGAVYKGRQPSLNRDVAIKVLPPAAEAGDLQFAERFQRESQAMARLNHPNLVTVHDAGRTPDGLLYYVMEYVEGEDVGQLLAAAGRIPPERAAEIIIGVCEALAFAHEEGIVHRDIKPSNVMIDRRGRVKVADFGLAKAMHSDETLLTRSDLALGTPDFAAPETFVPGTVLDGRADLYSTGVMLYQMLTGRIPRGRFEAPSGVVPRLDPRFDRIVDTAMQSDREKRYRSAAEMKQDLEGILSRSIHPATSSAPGTEDSHRRSARRTLILSAAGLLLALVGAGGFLLPRGDRNPEGGRGLADATKTLPPWVRVLDKPEDAPKANNRGEGVNWDKGWLVPVSDSIDQGLAMGRNGSVRMRVRHVEPVQNGAAVKLRSQSDNDGNPQSYELRVVNGMVLELTHAVMSPHPREKWRVHSTKLASLPLPQPLAEGEEYTLQLTMVGDRIQGRINDLPIGPVTDTRLPKGAMSVFSNGNPVRDIEYLNLDGLGEAEALKAAGIADASPVTTATDGVPDPVMGPDGRIVFPTGVWTRMHGREKDAREIPDNPGNRQDGPWVRLAQPGYGWFEHEVVPATNVGLRATFRGERVKENDYPQINLRGVKEKTPSLNLHLRSGKVQIRLTGPGYPVLAEAPLREPLPAGRDYTMEFYAIGARVFARVNGQLLTATTDVPPAPGSFSLFGADMDFFKDVHVLNLDGLGEAEALKAAGISDVPESADALPKPGEWVDATEELRQLGLAENRLISDGDWLVAKSGIHRFPVSNALELADAAVRVVFRGRVEVKLRQRAGSGTSGAYLVSASGAAGSGIGIAGSDKETEWVNAGLDRGTNVQPDNKKHELVFAAFGNQLMYWIDGQLRARIRDDRYRTGGIELATVLEEGGDPKSTAIKTVAYLSLDGLSEADAMKAAVAASAPPQPADWTDFTQALRIPGLGDASLKADGEWLEATREGYPSPAGGRVFRDFTARIAFANRIEVLFRKTPAGCYAAAVEGNVCNLLVMDAEGNRSQLVPAIQLPAGYRPEDPHELLVMANGPQLSIWIDGRKATEATDLRFSEGAFSLSLFADGRSKPARINKLEIGEF